jgi:hypothetical protein
MASVTWTCPSCGRRVPTRVGECHCGTSREAAELADAGRPGVAAREEIGWDVKALVIGMGLVLVLGVAWLFRPYRPDPIFPILGYNVNAPVATPTPPPPRPVPRPRFKLPWWK